MKETLGKRIAQCRKRQGMTQEKLAEALGVTAQAVSKWENDQSCPDISMLPRLAEMFGTTTDALLGHEAQTVHQAQIVEEAAEQADSGIHVQKGNWEFRYDAGRQGAVFFAMLVLGTGILTLLSALFQWDVSFWSILWPTALLVFGIQGLCSRFSFFSVGSTLFGGWFLLSNLKVIDFDLGGMVFPIVIILFGLSLLADALRRPKKKCFTVKPPEHKTPCSDCTVESEHFDCSASFGDSQQYICLDRLSRGEIDCTFCNLTVDLSGCDSVAPNCHVEADCSFGNLLILVPSRFQVVPETSTSFGNVAVEGTPDAEPDGRICLECDATFGQITLRYI